MELGLNLAWELILVHTLSQYFVLERKVQRTFRPIHRYTFYFETDAIVFCLLVCWQGYGIESQVTA